MRVFSLLLGPCSILPCARGLAGAPIMISLILLFCCYFWAYRLKLPQVNFLYSFFFWALLHNILAWLVHSIPWASLACFIPWASLAHFIPWASLALFLPLSLPWVFAKYFGLPPARLPRPYLLLLFGIIGLFTCPTNLLIHFLGFPDPFTSFLPLTITMGLLHSFLGLSSAHLLFPGYLLFCGPLDYCSYHSILLVFALLFSFLIFFILLGFFCYWALLSKVHQHTSKSYFKYLSTLTFHLNPYISSSIIATTHKII